jgi:hypothetical protein
MQKIYLSGERGKGLFALVDDEDFEELNKRKWCLDVGGGYAMRRTSKNGKAYNIRMHVQVLGTPKSMDTDHINRNKLDNRRSNLRAVSRSKNMHNVGIWKHNTSGQHGVTWIKERKKWMAQIQVNKKHIYLGLYREISDAVNARKKAEKKYAVC